MTAKNLALVFGIVLVLAGLLGFVSNPLIGATGLFLTNGTLDVVYIILGAILIGVALWATVNSALWLKIVGIIYLVLAILGFLLIPAGGTTLGLAADMATHWLHLIIGVVLVAAGFYVKDNVLVPARPMM